METASKTSFQSQPKILETLREALFMMKLVQHLSEWGMFVLTSDNRFATSPNRIFDGEACSMLTKINTGEKNSVNWTILARN